MARSTFSTQLPARLHRAPRPGQLVLFLDFDGVTHPVPEQALPADTAGITAGLGRDWFTAAPMDVLRRTVEALDAGLVIASSWRLLPAPMDLFDELLWGRVLGSTGEAEPSAAHPREAEVQDWHHRFAPTHPFALVDDKPSLYDRLDDRVIAPKPACGFASDDADALHALLAAGR